MLQSNLEELMNNYDINISDLSTLTGISRSTLTPLIKNPNEVLGLKLETVDILLDFFGLNSIDQLLKFVPEKSHYFVKNIKDISNTQPSSYHSWTTIFDMTKIIGSRERDIIIAGYYNDPVYNEPDFPAPQIFHIEFEALSKNDATQIEDNTLKNKNIVDGKVFIDDLKRQNRKNIEIVTGILTNSLVFSESFKKRNADLSSAAISATWNFASFSTRPFYTFDFEIEDDKLTSETKEFENNYEAF